MNSEKQLKGEISGEKIVGSKGGMCVRDVCEVGLYAVLDGG